MGGKINGYNVFIKKYHLNCNMSTLINKWSNMTNEEKNPYRETAKMYNLSLGFPLTEAIDDEQSVIPGTYRPLNFDYIFEISKFFIA